MSDDTSNVSKLDSQIISKQREEKATILTTHFRMNFDKLSKKLAFRAGTLWDAEDAMMDAYERAWKYLDTYDVNQPIVTWMSRIISNAVKDHVAKNMGRPDFEELDEEAVEGIPCEQYATRITEEIRKIISEQKPATAEILSLFFEKGYTANEISHLVEPTRLAINQTVYRFREQLKERYKNGGSLEA